MLGDFRELSGPVSFSAHLNTRSDGTHALALVMGDIHFSTAGICKYKPGVLTPQELAERIIGGMAPYCVDVFLEDVFRRSYDVEVAEPLGAFNQYWTKYIQGKRQGLPARYGSPPKEHVRVHATDFRQTGLVASFDGFFNEALGIRDYYNRLRDPTNPNKEAAWRELDRYMQAATTPTLDLQEVLTKDVLNAPRMQKQLISTSPAFRKIAENYLQDSVAALNASTEVFIKEEGLEGKDNEALAESISGPGSVTLPDYPIDPSLEFAVIRNLLHEELARKQPDFYFLEQGVLPELEKLINNMLESSVPVMDVYTVARILRKYDVTKRRPQGEGCPNTSHVQVAVIYVGDSHARNYRDWFTALGWKEVVPLIRGVDPNQRCLPIPAFERVKLEAHLKLIKREQERAEGRRPEGEEKKDLEGERSEERKEETKPAREKLKTDFWKDMSVRPLQNFIREKVQYTKYYDFKHLNWKEFYEEFIRKGIMPLSARIMHEPAISTQPNSEIIKALKNMIQKGEFLIYNAKQVNSLEKSALGVGTRKENLPYALLYATFLLQRVYNYLTYYNQISAENRAQEENTLTNKLMNLGEALRVTDPLEDDPLEDISPTRESPDLIVDAAQ